MNAWHESVGNCMSRFAEFTSKPERDYAASQASKMPGYIEHRVGDWKHPHRPRVYWLHIYYLPNKETAK